MKSRTQVALLLAAGFLSGWVVHSHLYPHKDRPVLSAIARVIRNWWWVPLVIDEPQGPIESTPPPSIIGTDGHPIVQHGRSI